jgi:MarR family transcriptional regulator, 2-MHQ and catechol-resistance regulon repressor
MESSISELLSLLFVIGQSMRESMRKSINRGKAASFLQFETLRYVKEHDRLLMRDVAHYFRITPPAATLLVDGLVRDKLLKRVVDTKDRRAVRVMITPAGRRYIAQGVTAHLERLKKLFSALSSDERAQLINILKKISKNIKTA